jgi:hypothetical protein
LPCAVIGFSSGFGRERTFSGLWEMAGGNMLEVQFRDDFTTANEEDDLYTFMNSVGPIMTDIEALSEQAGYLNIVNWGVRWGPERPDMDESQTVGDYYAIMIDLEYEGI